MLDKIDIVNILFFDIECVSEHASYDDLSYEFKKLWQIKTRQILKKYDEELNEEEARQLYPEKAAIFAEFGKVVCISVGIIVRNNADNSLQLRITSFADHDEKVLLGQFSRLLEKYYSNTHTHYLCGHNIKEFDVPYVCRRMVIAQMSLPRPLDISGKKPWETKHLLDTMELWKFGDRKNYTALKLLTAVFGIPSPKDDIDGSEVGKTYWNEGDLDRIAVYCEKDVLATTQLFMKYKRMDLFKDEQVKFVGRK